MKSLFILFTFLFIVSNTKSFSQTDYALSFNGTTDKGVLPQFFATDPTAFTIEWWFNPTSSSVSQTLSGGGTGWGWGAFIFGAYGDGSAQVGINLDGSYMSGLISPGTIVFNQWQHLAFTFNNGTGKFYKNGKLIAAKTGMTAPQNFNTLLLGCPDCGSQHVLGGMIDDIKIWSSERSVQDIRSDMYSTPAPQIANLAGYWNFNDAKVNVATDSSGNGKNGTLSGCTYVSYTKPLIEQHDYDYALSFNGTTDNGVLPQFFTTDPTAFTIEWWFNPTSSAVSQTLSGGGTGWGWGAFIFGVNSDGSAQVGTNLDGSHFMGLIPIGTIVYNRWQHLAFTFNNGTGKFYKNGILIASKTGMTAPENFNTLLLGCPGCGQEHILGGMIDDIKIWSVERSIQDIQSDIYSTPAPLTTNLAGYWNFNDAKAGIATDSSGRDNHGNLNGCTYVPYIKPIFTCDSITQHPTTITSVAANAKNILLQKINLHVVNNGFYANLDTLKLDLTGTTSLNDIDSLRIYASQGGTSTGTTSKVISIRPSSLQISLPLNLRMTQSTLLQVVADIAAGAKVDNAIKTNCPKVVMAGKAYYPKDTSGTATKAVIVARSTKVYNPAVSTDVIRNPGTGLVLYWEAYGDATFSVGAPKENNGLYYPGLFWRSVDSSGAARKASILYIRMPWSGLEPVEGQYAWNNNVNYQAMIQGALNRGLKIAFRIFFDGSDMRQQATPDFVRTAGANGYMSETPAWDSLGKPIPVWNPFYNDTVFLRKFHNFLTAFAAKYNDPATLAYLDALGMGTWGEGTGQMYFDPNQPNGNRDWAVTTIASWYRAAFPKILLGIQNITETDNTTINVIHNIADVYRRDSYGSSAWLSETNKKYFASEVGKGYPIFAENAFSKFSYTPTYHTTWGFPSNRAILVSGYNDVRDSRANTWDLRIPTDAVEWMKNPDLVDSLVNNLGYRLVPSNLYVDTANIKNDTIKFSSSWTNNGWGCFPNYRPAWNHRYKLAYALLDASGAVKKTFMSNMEPGDLFKGTTISDQTSGNINDLPRGVYSIGYAIVDTSNNNQPAINLAINDSPTASKWYLFGQVRIIKSSGTGTPQNDNTVVIYPNPAKNQLTILGNYSNEAFFKITDLNGKTIPAVKLNSNSINVSGLSAGIYFLEIIENGKVQKNIKFIKQ